MTTEHPILLFDGVCNLCNASVKFVLRHDPEGVFRFAPLQSAAAREYLMRYGIDPAALLSAIVIEDGRCYLRSAAALRIVRRLPWPWKSLYVLRLVPRPLRDAGYDLIAKIRYRIFGRTEACMVPTPEIAARFLA
jgi:predicted DCC family thiol-disulfide oxidoreductase YuxK